ncbi:MAG: hypothetical protein JW934_21085 [Anaerolineae bacterium]|nr:hypothetical protein [Anaerolineae bacterium]
MSKNQLKKPQIYTTRLRVIGAISASVILALVGVWFVIGAAQHAPSPLPTATSPAATAPFITKVVTAPPSATPLPPAATASPMPSPTANAPLELVIVHSNDTWGYTQPCG